MNGPNKLLGLLGLDKVSNDLKGVKTWLYLMLGFTAGSFIIALIQHSRG